jgi:hypothetical protein
LGFDKLNKKLFIGTEEGVFDLSGESYSKKTFVDSAVAAEAALRESGDSTLTSNLNSEISRATAAEGVIAGNLAQEIIDRAAAVSAEASARSSADSVLDGKITTEKGRIDAILSASTADADTFKEVVDLINSVDLTNDNALAAAVLSINDDIADETSARQSADTALGIRIDGVETSATALTSRVSAAEQDIVDLGTDLSAETSARQSAISSEQTARQSADTTLQSNIDSEASTRSTADTSLSNRLDALEGASADSRLDDLESDVADHETRITALETTIDGGVY